MPSACALAVPERIARVSFKHRRRPIRDGAAGDRRPRGAAHLFHRDARRAPRQLRIGVREQTGGRMSRELATRLSAGERLEVGTPMGRFRTAVEASRARTLRRLRRGQRHHTGPVPGRGHPGARAREPLHPDLRQPQHGRTMFLEDTLALKNRHLGRFSVYFVMSREPQQAPLLNGRIDAAKVEALARADSPTSPARTSISSAGRATWSMRCAARSSG